MKSELLHIFWKQEEKKLLIDALASIYRTHGAQGPAHDVARDRDAARDLANDVAVALAVNLSVLRHAS